MSTRREAMQGGRRLGMAKSSSFDDWYVGYSPRNSISTDNFNGASVEGSWFEWVSLAKQILEEDAARLAEGYPPYETRTQEQLSNKELS